MRAVKLQEAPPPQLVAATAQRVILGIDPGSRTAGYAFIRARGTATMQPRDFDILDAGVLRAHADLPIWERIGLLHEAVFELMQTHRPSVCVIETAFCDKNVQSALRLGEVRGAFIAAAGRASVAIEQITPSEVKKTITGNGRADKESISLTLKVLTGFDRGRLPHDVTDALAISLCYGLRLANRWQVLGS